MSENLQNPAFRLGNRSFLASLMLGGLGIYLIAGQGLEVGVGGEQSKASSEAKSVAYYVANIQEAKAVNKACYVTESASVKASEECRNALDALNLAHVGQNYQN